MLVEANSINFPIMLSLACIVTFMAMLTLSFKGIYAILLDDKMSQKSY